MASPRTPVSPTKGGVILTLGPYFFSMPHFSVDTRYEAVVVWPCSHTRFLSALAVA